MKQRRKVRVQLTLIIPAHQHALVREFAQQLVREGQTQPVTAIPDAYGVLVSLALTALEATNDPPQIAHAA